MTVPVPAQFHPDELFFLLDDREARPVTDPAKRNFAAYLARLATHPTSGVDDRISVVHSNVSEGLERRGADENLLRSYRAGAAICRDLVSLARYRRQPPPLSPKAFDALNRVIVLSFTLAVENPLAINEPQQGGEPVRQRADTVVEALSDVFEPFLQAETDITQALESVVPTDSGYNLRAVRLGAAIELAAQHLIGPSGRQPLHHL